MPRTFELPCELGDKVYSKVGGEARAEIRAFEVCDMAAYVYSDFVRIVVRGYIEEPDPFFNDGRMLKKFQSMTIGRDASPAYEIGFLTREEAEAYYEKFAV